MLLGSCRTVVRQLRAWPKFHGIAGTSAGSWLRRARRLPHHRRMIRATPTSIKPKKKVAVVAPTFSREQTLLNRGIWPVAGCDEAGRGPLAGPVVAAAVVLDPERIPKGLDDSKRLTAARRESLFEEICATASCAVAFASPARIDRDNILRASLWALARAVHALPEVPQHVFVDGRDRIEVPCDCDAVIGGDASVLSIAAASIVAKVSRDRLMCRLAQDCPGYGFEVHKGYGVPAHLEALRRLGPSVHHRRFFAPVMAAAERLRVTVEADRVAVEQAVISVDAAAG